MAKQPISLMTSHLEKLNETLLAHQNNHGILPALRSKYTVEFARLFSQWSQSICSSLVETGILDEAFERASSSGCQDQSLPNRSKIAMKEVQILLKDFVVAEAATVFVSRLKIKSRQLGILAYHLGAVYGLQFLGVYADAVELQNAFVKLTTGDIPILFKLEHRDRYEYIEDYLQKFVALVVAEQLRELCALIRDVVFLQKSNSRNVLKEITTDYEGFRMKGETVADTILQGILNFSKLDVFMSSGVEKVRWVAGPHKKREAHYKNSIQGYIPVGTEFISHERFPGEISLGCGCGIIPLIDEEVKIIPWLGK